MHHLIVILADGYPDLPSVKTAISLLQYRSADIVAVIDRANAGKTAGAVFGRGGEIPVIEKLQDAITGSRSPDSLYIGLAPPGGVLPRAWEEVIESAIMAGLDIVSGLHTFLSDRKNWVQKAEISGSRLIDLRKNQFRQVASGQGIREDCLRIHTVGTDCNIGKMVTSLELTRELRERGRDSAFVATGQTGMMISGNGLPVDAIVSDFVSGAAEQLVRDHQEHEILCIEGQGSLTSPMYSAVTVGLLHGCQPDGLVLCHEPTRKYHRHTSVPLPSLESLIPLYEAMASARHPCRVLGISLNSRTMEEEAYQRERDRLQECFSLPVIDPLRERTVGCLAEAVINRGRELGKLRSR